MRRRKWRLSGRQCLHSATMEEGTNQMAPAGSAALNMALQCEALLMTPCCKCMTNPERQEKGRREKSLGGRSRSGLRRLANPAHKTHKMNSKTEHTPNINFLLRVCVTSGRAVLCCAGAPGYKALGPLTAYRGGPRESI